MQLAVLICGILFISQVRYSPKAVWTQRSPIASGHRILTKGHFRPILRLPLNLDIGKRIDNTESLFSNGFCSLVP